MRCFEPKPVISTVIVTDRGGKVMFSEAHVCSHSGPRFLPSPWSHAPSGEYLWSKGICTLPPPSRTGGQHGGWYASSASA